MLAYKAVLARGNSSASVRYYDGQAGGPVAMKTTGLLSSLAMTALTMNDLAKRYVMR
jgi:hypothetical protein